ncbi:DUF421 domain-containing protein [Acinetobacter nectaris]|uniref:DUF421 domain-containing protein n=1 Tax=Acinetobacter nectaris TaxID=1219382 RepID=UPI001F40E76C|nr:YetF domain-containing protein [Acinetobacter nectaris]MCF9034925.1 DUF421 domain-containing protein [Acinetobacter nectaris]
MGLTFYIFLLVKLVIAFTIIISYMNFIGKTQLTQFTAVDFIGNFIFGAVVGGSIYNDGLKITEFVLLLLISVTFMYFLNYLSHHVLRFRTIAIGESIPIIRHGRFLLNDIEQKRRKIDMLRVLSQLHCMGYHSFQDVYYAEIQPDGQLAAVKDTAIPPSEIFILRGQLFSTLIKEQGIDRDRLEEFLLNHHLDLSNIFLGEYYDDHLLITFKDGKEKSFDISSIKIKEEEIEEPN